MTQGISIGNHIPHVCSCLCHR